MMFDDLWEDEETAAEWRAEARALAREDDPTPEELHAADVAEEYRREAWADAQPDEPA